MRNLVIKSSLENSMSLTMYKAYYCSKKELFMITSYFVCVNTPQTRHDELQPGVSEPCGTTLKIFMNRDGKTGRLNLVDKCSSSCRNYQKLLTKLKCPWCDEKFTTVRGLKLHIATPNGTKKKMHTKLL